ncbi:dTDP-4-dehydrorhamnose 3,5-epimerase [Lentibacter sp. XHP0401]|uniref:dTDP-4-dehydrorhamnose 3,5-epimerase n=1 Tax=Lentibacter sp. XHP0401 TaxID=2984334 RepID=UPI0021E8936D|nr:dTDP-4-dehydrorhamnose 3,5-epimerase [Lentibacter sp. XHP0401]MCV2893864.1 dTDP-4-dehydrorhamnose 3,5-epimerase [Lentibacter sp. XHP0401]
MIFRPLSLNGTFEVLLEPKGDQRGFFSRFYCDDEFAMQGLNTDWAQMNLSLTRGVGSLRGLHFQRGDAAEVKLVRCLRGRAYDVIVDLRKGSKSYGKHASIILDAESRNSIYIPKGFAHGFQALEDEVELQYFHSRPYSPNQEGGVNLMDGDLAINWPLPVAQLSQRDRTLPALTEVTPL